MTVRCEHCGRAQEAGAASEIVCSNCGKTFEPQNRAGRCVLAAVLVLLALLACLLIDPGGSGRGKGARQLIFGKAIAGRFERGGEAASTGESPSGGTNHLSDPQAANREAFEDRSIGRLTSAPGHRRPGDDLRAGAAGTDDPATGPGNARDGVLTTAPDAGAEPGNSARRNSVETPEGSESQTGFGTGANASGPMRHHTNRPTALLLDDFSERLRQAGARSGDVQISLEWKNINDLDLHVIDPNNEEIFYNHRRSRSGGLLDVDMNASLLTLRPVENVYWPAQGAPRGKYQVEVVHFANKGARDPTLFSVRVINKGQASYYRGAITYRPSNVRVRATVCTFEVR